MFPEICWKHSASYTTDCCKYFGCELGAQTQFNVKDERYIVNGAHDAAKLQDMLDGFIKKWVELQSFYFKNFLGRTQKYSFIL